MKYLAILKDSLREALDSKVFYVAIGLSCLLIVVVACISFEPLPAQEALQHIATMISSTRVARDRDRDIFERMSTGPAHFEISDIHALTEATEPQQADYGFHLRIQEFGPGDLKRAVYFWNSRSGDPNVGSGSIPQVSDSLLEEFIKDRFTRVGNLQIAKIERVAPASGGNAAQEYFYTIETKGTRSSRAWLHDPQLLFGKIPLPFMRTTLGQAVFAIEALIVNGIGAWVGILLGVVITAMFIPNMLRKGTIDLLLVKPIHRSTLLVYKYIGGLTFMFLNTLVAVGGIWLVIGLRSGIWSYEFLLSILVITFFFAVLYSVSTFAAVATRSPIVAILVTCFVWFGLYLVGSSYTGLENARKQEELQKSIPSWVFSTVDKLHYVLPRTKDLDLLMTRLLSQANLTDTEIRSVRSQLPESITWGESLTVCGLFIGVMLGLSCLRFARQDY